MIYVQMGVNFCIEHIYDEKSFKKRVKERKSKYRIVQEKEIKYDWCILYDSYLCFNDVLEAKITIALLKVKFYEEEMNKPNRELKEKMYQDYTSIPKTKRWLKKQEEKYPEYFI